MWPSSTQLEIFIEKNADNFLMIQPDGNNNDYHVDIDQNSLELVFQRFVPLPHIRDPGSNIAKEMITELVFNTYPVSKDSRDVSISNQFLTTPLPGFILFAFVDSDAILGSKNNNPFRLKKVDYRAAYLTIDNVRIPGVEPYSNMGQKQRLFLYHEMMRQIGYDRFRNPEEVPLSFDEFFGDYNFIAFDLSPGKDGGVTDSIPVLGSLSFHVTLDECFTSETHLISFHTNRLQLHIHPEGKSGDQRQQPYTYSLTLGAEMKNLRELAGL